MYNDSIWKESIVVLPRGTTKKFRPAGRKAAMRIMEKACMGDRKTEICMCGVELKTLSLDDIRYIAEDSTTEYAAEQRLRTRRQQAI